MGAFGGGGLAAWLLSASCDAFTIFEIMRKRWGPSLHGSMGEESASFELTRLSYCMKNYIGLHRAAYHLSWTPLDRRKYDEKYAGLLATT